nr:polymorphic toxin type 25 domain-containing protein [Cronobacter sakazakii]
MKVDNDSFSVSTGYTKEFGVKAGASIVLILVLMPPVYLAI